MKPVLRSIFIALLLGLNLQAQSLTGVKIDDLSDAQIQAILDRGTSQGMSQDQGEQWALSMGLSPEEAVKFKARAEALNATNAASGDQNFGSLDFISGPRTGSTFSNRSKGMTASFTQ